MIDNAGEALLAWGSSPWAIGFAIILATFVIEDATTIGAALLAATGTIAPSLALAALFIGIFTGDLGLYGLGAVARTNHWARHLIGERRMVKGRHWLKQHFVAAVIGARFLPGFRMPAYTASGFLGLSFPKFAALTAGAGLVWSATVFSLVYYFGVMFADQLGVWRWALIGLLLTISLGAPMLAERALGHTVKIPTDHH
jgi:membrane protein DedA with SNARE-associated domain